MGTRLDRGSLSKGYSHLTILVFEAARQQGKSTWDKSLGLFMFTLMTI
jgi:hypothetical protein